MSVVYTPGNVNVLVNQCAGRPMEGPLGALPPEWNKQRQVFGIYLDNIPVGGDAFLAQNTPPLAPFTSLVYANSPTPTWWTINIYGLEVGREVDNGVFTPSLSRDALVNDPNVVRATRLKARVEFELLEQNRVVDIDIGTGVRLGVHASAVRVKLLGPVGTVAAPDRRQLIVVGTTTNQARDNDLEFDDGLLIDAIVGCSILPGFANPTDRYVTFTERITQDDGSAISRPLPSGAKYLTIYSNENQAPVNWRWMQAFGAPFVDYGVVIPDATTIRTNRIAVPQNVTAINKAGAAAADLGWTFVWELDL